MATKINGRTAASTIAAREDFDSYGALRGRNHKKGTPFYQVEGSYSKLPAVDHMRLEDALRAGDVYVVLSYETPIAWFSEATGLWTRPAVKYSMTTSHHQGRCPVDGEKGLYK